MVSVVLADARPVARSGMRSILENTLTYQIIGEASDGLEALKLVKELQPNVLITTFYLPALNGIEITHQITAEKIPTNVLLLSFQSNEDLMGALHAGVTGYIFKDASPEEFLTAVGEVAAGRRYLTPSLAERAIDIFVAHNPGDATDPYETLSNREREVLQLSAEGQSNKEIAERLFISPRTVETHRENLMRKLNLANQTELVRFALNKGIIK